MIKVLFVDDEEDILRGLKRTLRKLRHQWDMHFANSGEKALQLLSDGDYDVIVSDMRMPGMSGAELLEKVKKDYPGIIRFILSGHSDNKLVMRSVGASHQYLSKPCDLSVLSSRIDQSLALRALLTSDMLRELSAEIDTIPSMPDIYRSVVEEMGSDDPSIVSIGKLIEQDIGMTAKLLKLVNSAYFGIARTVRSPVEAANLLGMDTLKSLILLEGAFSEFDESSLKTLSIGNMRHKAFRTAQLAKSIAVSQGVSEEIIDQSYLGGLLHEIGILILAANLPDKHIRIFNLLDEDKYELLTAEHEVLGITHAEIGAYVLSLWGIDEDVITAIAYQNTPTATVSRSFTPLTALVAAKLLLLNNNEQPLYKDEITSYLESQGLSDKLDTWSESMSHLIVDAA